MDKKTKTKDEYYVIDLRHVFKSLWKRMWLIVVIGLLAGAIGYGYATYFVAPTYSSHIKLYVNNSAISVGNSTFSISSSELSAAQSLVKTYGEILDSRSTLVRVAEEADVDYSWQTLSSMIRCSTSNNTEIMMVTVTSTDPYEASNIAEAISVVLPIRIDEIIDGATMAVVDAAVPEMTKVGPDITRYTTLGLVLGLLIAAIVIVVIALMDGTIHDEEYVMRTYDYPILGKVPDLLGSGNKSYGYYTQNQYKANT